MPAPTYLNPTLVTFEGGGLVLSPYGARGITQTYGLIDAAKAGGVRRDINGNAIDLTYGQFQKIKSSISCADQDTPTLDGVGIGALVTVECAFELSRNGGANARTAVSGSERTDTATGITYYRPSLSMIVTAFSSSFDEYAATYTWSIDLEEV